MKKFLTVVLVLAILGAGGWYYLTMIYATPIGNILTNPRDYSEKQVAISGTVTESFSLFVVRYFILQDPTGKIVVVTEKPLPQVGAKVRVEGRVDDSFSFGNQQTLVFLETPL